MIYDNLNHQKSLLNLSLTHLNIFNDIAAPLKYMGISTFSYYYINDERKAVYFSDNKNWHTKHYLNPDGMAGLTRCIIFSNPKYILDKIVYTGDPNFNLFAPNRPMNGNEMFNNNLWNALCFYIKNPDNSYESFNFFGGNSKTQLPDIFIRYEFKFRKFISFFKSKFDPIIASINKDKLINVSVENNFKISSKFRKSNTNFWDLERKIIINKNEIIFTKQQWKLLKCLNNGIMIKNIPDLVGIKPYNIDPLLKSLKLKLKVNSNKNLLLKIKKSIIDYEI